MPLFPLPADAQLDAPKLAPLPPDAKLDMPAGQQSDTSTWYQRAAHGFAAPMVGLDELASKVEQHLPFISPETKAQDLRAAQQERQQFESEAPKGFSGWEMVGNLANPLNYMIGGPAKGAGLAATVGRAAMSGAGSAVVQPGATPKSVAAGAALGGAVGVAAEPIARAIEGHSPEALDRFIKDTFDRTVKPSVVGKGSMTQLNAYNDKVASAISSIVTNKPSLRFVDEAGEVTTGKLPRSLNDFAQAIDQTKKEIFKHYDALAKAAGSTGISVPLNPAVAELRKVGNSTVVKDLDPGIAAYANQMADTLTKRGGYTPEEAQQAIAHLNTSLQAFYKNPSREAASHAAVDAAVASALRKSLDDTIEKAGPFTMTSGGVTGQVVGPGYQALKNQYGALRTLEKDVVHRAIVSGRQNVGGGLMGNFGDVFSAEEAIRGILHFNPAAIATGAGLKMFTNFTRYLRSPNRAISKLFDAAEKRAGPPPSATQTGVAGAIRTTAPVAGSVGGASAYNAMTGQMQ